MNVKFNKLTNHDSDLLTKSKTDFIIKERTTLGKNWTKSQLMECIISQNNQENNISGNLVGIIYLVRVGVSWKTAESRRAVGFIVNERKIREQPSV